MTEPAPASPLVARLFERLTATTDYAGAALALEEFDLPERLSYGA